MSDKKNQRLKKMFVKDKKGEYLWQLHSVAHIIVRVPKNFKSVNSVGSGVTFSFTFDPEGDNSYIFLNAISNPLTGVYFNVIFCLNLFIFLCFIFFFFL